MISKFYNLDAQMLLSEANTFTALHAMQTRSSDENSVCPSVKRVHCDKTEERFVQIFIPYERSFSLVFWEKEWVGGGATPSTWNFVSNWPRWSEIADLRSLFARSDSSAIRLCFQLTLLANIKRYDFLLHEAATHSVTVWFLCAVYKCCYLLIYSEPYSVSEASFVIAYPVCSK